MILHIQIASSLNMFRYARVCLYMKMSETTPTRMLPLRSGSYVSVMTSIGRWRTFNHCSSLVNVHVQYTHYVWACTEYNMYAKFKAKLWFCQLTRSSKLKSSSILKKLLFKTSSYCLVVGHSQTPFLFFIDERENTRLCTLFSNMTIDLSHVRQKSNCSTILCHQWS